MLKELLQGKWLKHPLHPVVVSIPLGLWPISLLLDLISLGRGGNRVAVTAAFYCLAVGLAGALVAVATGLADFSEVKPDKPARKVGYLHLALNATGTLFWIGSLALHFRAADGGLLRVPPGALVCSLAGCALSLAAAYLGGRMVYEHGIGVGRYSKKQLRELAIASNNNVPEEKR
jgi:uncharacterized membrane protein